jgi:hypothetical protein
VDTFLENNGDRNRGNDTVEEKKMTTKRVLPGQWKDLFDRFTRQYLRDDLPETVTIEVVSPEIGDQFSAQNARLVGVTYDSRSEALEILLAGSDHLVFRPIDIWVTENEADGFLEIIDVVRVDGTKEIIHLRRSGVPA